MTPAELRAAGARLFPEVGAAAPSPLERWSLPPGWPGEALWVKRDDLLGEAGTKLRKLRVALPRLRAQGRGLVTVGHLDSNHALATAHLGAALGVPVELVVLGRPRRDPGRAALLRAAAPISFHATTVGLLAGVGCARWRGRAAFLPPGATTALTTAAVALGVAEVLEQSVRELPAKWIVAVGTGGTLAGLWAGVRALGLSVRLVGVAASSRLVGQWRVARLANQALALLGSGARVRRSEVVVEWSALGAGHGAPTRASAAALQEFGALGYALEPIFTAKALAALRGRAVPGESWLFWHTGLSVH